MSRLAYHSTYTESQRTSRLPHFQTSFEDARSSARHPMDYKYPCGFDPIGKTLKQCADHWRTCKSESCIRKSNNYELLKDELLDGFRPR